MLPVLDLDPAVAAENWLKNKKLAPDHKSRLNSLAMPSAESRSTACVCFLMRAETYVDFSVHVRSLGRRRRLA
jgi:hypothetical protein